MVAQKITCPSRSDDIGNQYINSNTKRYGFFANESQDSKYFESGRPRSFKARKESAGERYKRSDYRRKNRTSTLLSAASGHHQLFRGKDEMPALAYLKPEPVFESKMFHDMDSEFFRDLDQLFSGPAKDELVQTTDSTKKTEESAHNTDTLHTPLSPQGWEVFDANSPAHTDFYLNTPNDSLSPNMDGFSHPENKFLYSSEIIENEKKFKNQSPNWDITNLPVVLSGDLAHEKMMDLNPCFAAGSVIPHNIHDTEYTKTTDTHNKMLFFNQEDYLDPVITHEVENNDVVISEIIINQDLGKAGILGKTEVERRGPELSLDLTLPIPWDNDAINTPEVVSYVAEMEKEDYNTKIKPWPLSDYGFISVDTSSKITASPLPEYEPITPKSESHIESDADETQLHSNKRRRRDSEDSDETYTPYTEQTTRKYKRRKPNIPIKDMILALEGSQQLPKARRGRPPKRRESTVSSICSIEDNASSVSTHENKYRELRDKNNEASKRSRKNRKLKELQMEQLADDLEERNKKLKVKADILEDMTKRLKDALMTAILQK